MNSIVAQERIIALRKKRSAQDLRFKYYGFIAMCLALAVLVFLLYSIFSRGFSAFQKTTILLEINYDQEVLKLTHDSTVQEFEKGKFFKVKNLIITNKKSFTIIQVAKLFNSKIKFLPPRKGERYASALTKISSNNKIIQK